MDFKLGHYRLLIAFTVITIGNWTMQYNTDYTLLQIIKMEFASIWHMMHRIW